MRRSKAMEEFTNAQKAALKEWDDSNAPPQDDEVVEARMLAVWAESADPLWQLDDTDDDEILRQIEEEAGQSARACLEESAAEAEELPGPTDSGDRIPVSDD